MVKQWVQKQVVKAVANHLDFHNFKEVQLFGFGAGSNKRLSDEVLTNEGFATNSDLRAIIERLSQRTAEVEVSTQRNNINIEQGLFYDLFFNDPDESFFSKVYKSITNIKCSGDIFLEFKTSFLTDQDSFGNQVPSRVKVHRSGLVTINQNSDNSVKDYTVSEESESYNVPSKYMLHIKLYDPSTYGLKTKRGISRVQSSYKVLHASNEIQTASASIYKNQGASALISDKSGILADGDNAKKLQKALDDRIGGSEKAGKVTITGADATLLQLGMSSKDLELLKSQPMKLRQLCAVFGDNSIMYNDPEGTTYNNVGFARKQTFINGVRPDLRLFIDEVNRYMQNWDSGVFLVADYSKVEELQADKKEEADKNTVISNGVQAVLTNESLNRSQKITILVDVWKMDKEKAQTITQS